MNLYVFEPYEWAYCGGAIGVIAKTFDEAVSAIVKNGNIQANCERYRTEYFQATPKTFKKDASDQWLLSNKIALSNKHIVPRILFDNWNDA